MISGKSSMKESGYLGNRSAAHTRHVGGRVPPPPRGSLPFQKTTENIFPISLNLEWCRRYKTFNLGIIIQLIQFLDFVSILLIIFMCVNHGFNFHFSFLRNFTQFATFNYQKYFSMQFTVGVYPFWVIERRAVIRDEMFSILVT